LTIYSLFMGLFLGFFICLFSVLRLDLRAYTWSHSISPFLWKVFEIRSSKLFAQAVSELWSSWSQPPE
jgi:hypothetical protein